MKSLFSMLMGELLTNTFTSKNVRLNLLQGFYADYAALINDTTEALDPDSPNHHMAESLLEECRDRLFEYCTAQGVPVMVLQH